MKGKQSTRCPEPGCGRLGQATAAADIRGPQSRSRSPERYLAKVARSEPSSEPSSRRRRDHGNRGRPPQKASEASDRVLAGDTETRVPGGGPAATAAARRRENAGGGGIVVVVGG